MKKLFTLFAMMFLLVGGLFAQKLSYQAVVRDNNNKLVVNTALTVEVSILDANNGVQYAETHTATSNQNGLIVLTIGDGTPTAGTDLSAVNWENATINSVIKNGSTTVATIASPVNAVPYALQAANASGSFSQVQADWAEDNTSSKAYIANKPFVPANTSDLNNDAGFITAQDISGKANAADVYTKAETDNLLNAKANTADVTTALGAKADTATVKAALATKANTSDIPTTVASLTDAADYAKVADMTTALGAKADTAAVKAALATKANTADLATVATSGNYNDLTNKPTIPTAVTQLTDADNYVTDAELAAAGYLTSYTETDPTVPAWAKEADKPAYDYSEIANTPTIPVVNDGTLTIKQGTQVLGTFTANDNGNVTVEIPTQAIPDQVKSDWNATTGPAEILNKPTIPTSVAQLTDADNYVTDAELAAAGYLTSYTETDPTIKAWAKADTKPTYDYSEIQNTPAIPAAQVQADWAEDNTASKAYIANKPFVPANTSDLNNDAGFITAQDITGYATQSALNDSVADLKAQMNQISSQLNQLMTALTALQVTSKRFVATAEQTQFNLGQATTGEIVCYVNGVMVGSKTSGVITVSGTTVTYVPAQNYNYELQAGDVVTFMYIANN